jgi:hypothetical protein
MNDPLGSGGVLAEQGHTVVADIWNEDFKNALRVGTGPAFPLDLENMVGSSIAVPIGPQCQSHPPVADVRISGNKLEVRTNPGWTVILFEPIVCRAAVAEPGCKTPGIANNGVALRLPPTKLPSENPSAVAPGCYLQRALTEVSAGSTTSRAVTEVPGKRRPSTRRAGVRPRVDKPNEFECERCTKAQGFIVSFTCPKDLRRHMETTKAHNARAVAYCSCGKSVTRRDAMRSHRRHCRRGTTVEPGATEGQARD